MKNSYLFSQEGKLLEKQLTKIYGQLRLSRFLQLDKEKFWDFIKKIESDPLFKRLMYPPGPEQRKDKVISYVQFPRTSFSSGLSEFIEKILKTENIPDIESMLISNKKVVKIIKSIGIEKFKKYFLLGSFDGSIKDIAVRCRISESNVKDIITFTDNFFIKSRFFSSLQNSLYVHYHKVGAVYRYKRELTIGFSDLYMARGRYRINYERLDFLKKNGSLAKNEIKDVNRIISALNLINLRKSLLFESILLILDKQKDFFKTANLSNLIPFTQKEAARELKISPSLLSRVIKYKSIETPWGEEKPLNFFFPSLKTVRVYLLSLIIDKYPKIKSDRQAQAILKNEHGVYVSRRTVAKYRKELSFSSFAKKDEPE